MPTRDDGVHRYVRVGSWRAAVGRSLSLELRGTLDEPFRDVLDIVVTLYSHDQPLVEGFLYGLRPAVNVTVFCPRTMFDHAWSLAMNGHLLVLSLWLTKPHRGKATVLDCWCSNEPEDGDAPGASEQV